MGGENAKMQKRERDIKKNQERKVINPERKKKKIRTDIIHISFPHHPLPFCLVLAFLSRAGHANAKRLGHLLRRCPHHGLGGVFLALGLVIL